MSDDLMWFAEAQKQADELLREVIAAGEEMPQYRMRLRDSMYRQVKLMCAAMRKDIQRLRRVCTTHNSGDAAKG